jgi:hypothetical protein
MKLETTNIINKWQRWSIIGLSTKMTRFELTRSRTIHYNSWSPAGVPWSYLVCRITAYQILDFEEKIIIITLYLPTRCWSSSSDSDTFVDNPIMLQRCHLLIMFVVSCFMFHLSGVLAEVIEMLFLFTSQSLTNN